MSDDPYYTVANLANEFSFKVLELEQHLPDTPEHADVIAMLNACNVIMRSCANLAGDGDATKMIAFLAVNFAKLVDRIVDDELE